MIEVNNAVVWTLLLLASTFLTLLAMPLVIRLAHRAGAVDQPDPRKVHRHVVSRLGGLAFLLSLLAIPVSMLPYSSGLAGFMAGLIVIALTGLADDIMDLSPRWKFLGLFAGSLLFVLVSDTAIRNLGDLFALGDIETGMLAIPVTVVATVGFINALNLSDGLDGLAGGIALIAVFFLGCFALHAGDQLSLVLSVTLFGCMVGFLYFNSHPARVFMGDTGSLVLGYVLAAVSLLLIKAHGIADTPISPVLMGTLLGLPLADTLYVMGRRVMKGASPFLPDQTHFHHRLMRLGLTHGGVVATMYAIMMVYGVAALALIRTPAWTQMAALLGLIALTYGVLHCLEKGCVSLALKDAGSGQHPASGLFYEQLTRLTGKTVPWMTWFIPASLLLPVVSIDVKGNLLIVVGTVMLLAIVLYPWRESRDDTWLSGIVYLLVF
ncbi:MAG TPA: MraY family glycosyltransferase, partial [Mariprofundaceae bacterium]|nr:MraY family glycosyltransferase [Mariprofundaceae bacterium]